MWVWERGLELNIASKLFMFQLIPPNFNGNMVKGRVTKLDTQDKLEMKYAVLEYVTDAQFPVPPSWPRLKPLK